MRRRILIIVGIILILVLIFVCLLTIFLEDHTAPVIEFEEEEMVYTKGEDMEELLDHVKAVDDVDGDVSNSLIIGNINILTGGQNAKILFAAKDSKNNVAKASKIVKYKKADKKEDENSKEKTNIDVN